MGLCQSASFTQYTITVTQVQESVSDFSPESQSKSNKNEYSAPLLLLLAAPWTEIPYPNITAITADPWFFTTESEPVYTVSTLSLGKTAQLTSVERQSDDRGWCSAWQLRWRPEYNTLLDTNWSWRSTPPLVRSVIFVHVSTTHKFLDRFCVACTARRVFWPNYAVVVPSWAFPWVIRRLAVIECLISRQSWDTFWMSWSWPAWLRGRTSVSVQRSFAVPRSTCSWWVTTYVGKPSAIGQPTRPTQPVILSGSINE